MTTDIVDEIILAASTECEMLDLSGRALKSLPLEISVLTKLKALDLSRNQLTSLPPEIGSLARLVELEVSQNCLVTLPSEIGRLSDLEILSLADNSLMDLTSEIGKLTRLRHLHLQNNKLPSLPPDIGNLTKLRQLWIQSNLLTDLPRELCRLRALEDWDFTRKQLPPRFPRALIAHDNPLIEALPEMLLKGTRALLDFLAKSSERYTVDLYDYVPELKNLVLRRKIGDYEDCVSAIAACRDYVDGFLEQLGTMAANELLEIYGQSGGIPSIGGGPRACIFPHRSYAPTLH